MIETGTASGLDVFKTPNQVTAEITSFEFGETFSTAPVLLADMQTTNGPDTATLRITNLTASSVSLFVDEKASEDSETAHIDEVVGYVSMEHGLIYGDTVLV